MRLLIVDSDVMMCRGYGLRVLSSLRSLESCSYQYPRVLGRDFSGEVVAVGGGVTRVGVGDEVWGAIFPSQEGSHQELCLASESSVSLKPKSLSHLEAASVPYAGLTAWSAISSLGLRPGARVIVVGGAGGVGLLACQLLEKFFQCRVTVLAAEHYHLKLTSYGAFQLIDNRKNPEDLQQLEKVELVLDCAGLGLDTDSLNVGALLAAGGSFVSLTSPILSSTDRLGLIPGLVSSLSSVLQMNLTKSSHQYRWAFYQPDCRALEIFTKLADQKTLLPTVNSVYNFENLVEAYKKVDEGHFMGKIVIDMEKSDEKL